MIEADDGRAAGQWKLLRSLMLVLAGFLLAAASCGADLVADAGEDRNVPVGATVELDGSGSRGSGDLEFAWALQSAPAGSAAELQDADTPTPTFVADAPGEYRAELIVSSGAAMDSDIVLITAGASGQALEPGGVVEGPDGAAVGAPEGALESAVQVRIEVEDMAALPPLGAGIEPVGQAFRFASTEPFDTPADIPLVVGLPLPPGADAGEVEVAVLAPAVGHGPGEGAQEPYAWIGTEGQLDAENDLVLAPVHSFSTHPEGIVLGLIRDEEALASRARASRTPWRATPQAEVVGRFAGKCSIKFDAGDCTPEEEEAAARAGNVFYREMVTERGFFAPSIRPLVVDLKVTLFPPSVSASVDVARHLIDLIPDGKFGCKGDWEGRGRYVQPLKKVYICMPNTSGNDMTTERMETVNHEVFHGIQYSYPYFMEATGFGRKLYWPMVEGGANAATLSRDAMTTDGGGRRHPIDVPLASDLRFSTTDDDYASQSFWVFVGRRQDVGIDYFQEIFFRGFTPRRVDAAFQALFGSGYGLADAYWDWVKNVAFEAQVTGGDLGLNAACVLDERFIRGDRDDAGDLDPPAVRFDPGVGISNYNELVTELEPLSARVFDVELLSGGADYFAEIDVDIPNPNIRIKFYEPQDAASTDCHGVPDGGSYTTDVDALDGIKRVRMLIANVGFDHTPAIFTSPNDELDIGFYLPLEITEPPSGETFSETTQVTFEAEVSDRITDFTIDWESDQGDPITPLGPTTAATQLLCPGRHEVTATLQSDTAGEAQASVVVHMVNRPPAVEITSPPSEVAQGSFLSLTAQAEDYTCTSLFDNVAVPSNVQWYVDGTNVATGASLAYQVSEPVGSTLSVEARYTDGGTPSETSSSAPANIDVVAPPAGGADPVPVITEPADGASHLWNVDIVFEGYANDAEDGTDFASGGDLTWLVDDEPVGNGKSLVFNFEDAGIDPGPREIALEAMDSDGQTGRKEIMIQVDVVQ